MTRLPASTVYFVGELWLALAWAVTFTVTAVYFVTDVGMNPFQLVLVGTVMELAIFVFEVPTGVIADTYGRRLSLVIGWVVMGAGMIVVGSIASFPFVLLGYAVWGFGYTFTSGALEAWITDEVGAARVGRVFARGQQLGYVGGLLGIGVSVAVASWSLGLAVALGGALSVAYGVFAAVVMPERGFGRPDRTAGGLRSMGGTAIAGVRFVRAQPVLLLLLAITFFAGASTESFDRLWQAHLIRGVGLPELGALDPVVWFGIFGAVSMVLGLIASEVLVRRFERVGQARLARLLLAFSAVQAAAAVAFALAGSLLLAAGAMWLYFLTRSLVAPVYQTWLNEQITDSSVRATVISITGQTDAVGQVVGGPGLGALGTVFSLRTALLAGASLLLPAVALYARAARHGGAEPELEQLAAVRHPDAPRT